MACGCIKRQEWLVKKLCKNGEGTLCQKARERLERMQAREKGKAK